MIRVLWLQFRHQEGAATRSWPRGWTHPQRGLETDYAVTARRPLGSFQSIISLHQKSHNKTKERGAGTVAQQVTPLCLIWECLGWSPTSTS